MFQYDRNNLILDKPLGRGSFGFVYPYKKDGPNGREDQWVVKIVQAKDFTDFTRIVQEALFGFSFDHPAVLPIKGFSCDAKRVQDTDDKTSPYEVAFLMPRMARSLRDEINEYKRTHKSYDEGTLMLYFHTLISGVEYLHSKRIIHRDIKPENILISKDGGLKLADVGIAKLVLEGKTQDDATGGLIGTIAYMAPEIIKDKLKNIDLFYIDQWSLGIVLAELCLLDKGISPMREKTDIPDDVKETINKIRARGYSENMTALLGDLLSLKPDQRGSARELRVRVQQFLGGFPVRFVMSIDDR